LVLQQQGCGSEQGQQDRPGTGDGHLVERLHARPDVPVRFGIGDRQPPANLAQLDCRPPGDDTVPEPAENP
jgi:hypothetical protein